MKTYCTAFAKMTLPTTPAAQVAALNDFMTTPTTSAV